MPAGPNAAELFRGAGNRLLLQCPICPPIVQCSTHRPNGGVERGNANTPLIKKTQACFLSYDSGGGVHIPFLLSICSGGPFQNNSIGRSPQLLIQVHTAAKSRWVMRKTHTVLVKHNSPEERPYPKIWLLPLDSSRSKTSQALESKCPFPLHSRCCVLWKNRSPSGTGPAGSVPE